jgi:hypothetical protein
MILLCWNTMLGFGLVLDLVLGLKVIQLLELMIRLVLEQVLELLL